MFTTLITILVALVLVGYFLPQIFITAFLLSQARLLYLSWKYKQQVKQHKSKPQDIPLFEMKWPMVTVQLPIYNEFYVVERLVNSISALDYPKDKFEIQILDDSTDETSTLIKNKLMGKKDLLVK